MTFMDDWIAGYFNTEPFSIDVSTLGHDHHWCNVYVPGQQNINVLDIDDDSVLLWPQVD